MYGLLGFPPAEKMPHRYRHRRQVHRQHRRRRLRHRHRRRRRHHRLMGRSLRHLLFDGSTEFDRAAAALERGEVGPVLDPMSRRSSSHWPRMRGKADFSCSA